MYMVAAADAEDIKDIKGSYLPVAKLVDATDLWACGEMVNTSDLNLDEATLVGSTPSRPTKEQILALYPEFHTVYGPYKRKDNRSIFIFYDGILRTARQCARVIMEVHLGRRLTNRESIDHIDENIANDIIENLRVLTVEQNSSWSARKSTETGTCKHCKKLFKLTRNQRTTRARSKDGPYCSLSCRSLIHN